MAALVGCSSGGSSDATGGAARGGAPAAGSGGAQGGAPGAGRAAGGSSTAGAGGDASGGAAARAGAGGAPRGGDAGRSTAGGGTGAGRGGAGSGGVAGAGAPNGDAGSNEAGASGGGNDLALPPVNGGLDYQLGGAYTPANGVSIVSRDRQAAPAPGLYNICYVNGFQIQENEESFWLDEHPDLVLRDEGGEPVVDEDWDEMLVDVSTGAKRDAIAAIVGEWIRGCADDGFDAVEIDNLDSFSRSGGRLTESNNVAMMRQFADAAHAAGLAAAQKNSAELVGRRAELGTDFAVAEECNRWSECDAYTEGYGDHVLVIEYRQGDFDAGCADYPNLSIVLRDLNLVTPSSGAYVYDGC